jgi:hypothetical protein
MNLLGGCTNLSAQSGGKVQGLLALLILYLAAVCQAQTTAIFTSPSDDQWQYPFNFSPGLSTDRSIFAASTPPFDKRDALALVRWDTSTLIPPSAGPENYLPTRVTVRVWEPAGANWPMSATQVVQLFAVGYGPTYTEAAWSEDSAVVANGLGPPVQRDPYPLTLGGARAENNILAQPWAVGVPEPSTATARAIEFELDVLDPPVLQYLREGLDRGFLTFAVSSTVIPDSSMAVPGTLPRVIFKEGTILYPGSSAPELSVTLAPERMGTEHRVETPNADVWQYPFNGTPGVRTTAPLFSAGPPFNYRDGEFLVGFGTDTVVEAGKGLSGYNIEACSVRVWSVSGSSWDIRGTTSEIELFGTGFGPTYTAEIWSETSGVRATAPGPPPAVLRDPYPMTLEGNRAEDDTMALPWAIGRTLGYNPGAAGSPFAIQFDLDVAEPAIQQYLRQGLDNGTLFFHITTTRDSSEGTINLITKENPVVGSGAGPSGGNAHPAQLILTVNGETSSVELWELY